MGFPVVISRIPVRDLGSSAFPSNELLEKGADSSNPSESAHIFVRNQH